MRTVGLFAGIGGLELGFQRAGWESTLLAESDPLCQSVLRRRFDSSSVVGDVAGIRRLPSADMLIAGFPCQPYSQVGPMKGLADGASHLAQIFRLIDSARRAPSSIVLENVPNIVHLDGGRALLHVLSSLEDRGYRWAYRVIDSAAFGLPQRRRRWYLVASLEGNPAAVLLSTDREVIPPTAVSANGFYWTEGTRGIGWAVDAIPPLKSGSTIGIPGPPAIWDHIGRGIWTPDIRDAERLQGFRAGWTDVAETASSFAARRRWHMVGNAVSVPVSQWIAERIRDDVNGEVHGDVFSRDHLPKAAFYDRKRRFSANVGLFPVQRSRLPIMDFLKFAPHALSLRATKGFRERYEAGPLRKHHDFVQALRYHEKHSAA